MKAAVSLVLVYLACVASGEDATEEYGFFDYHHRIGMPEAARIRKLEADIVSNRVAGGSTTTIASVPYQAGLIITFRFIQTSICGGSIISDTRILTAAHCNNDGNSIAQSITVVVGSNFLFTGGTRLQVSGVATYPGYNPRIIANDVAVMIVPRITYSLLIQPINLPSGSELDQLFVGEAALATGFGITRDGESPGVTQMISAVEVRVISNAVCASSYSGIIQNSHLCTSGAGGVGTCPGDTGGPLVATINRRRVLIGITSFTPPNGCQRNMPSGFSRVGAFTRWIQSV